MEERVIIGKSSDLLVAEHKARYCFAANKLYEKKDILDVGSGDGYGVSFLRECRYVAYGVEFDDKVVRRAIRKYGGYFYQGDIHDIPIRSGYFDAVVCFEVIEHIHKSEKAFSELRRVVKKGGVLILSTPNKALSKGDNEFHLHEYNTEEIVACLTDARFSNIKLYGQKSKEVSAAKIYRSKAMENLVKIRRFFGLQRGIVPLFVWRWVEKLFGLKGVHRQHPLDLFEFIENDHDCETIVYVATAS